jgi:hypothetical protein
LVESVRDSLYDLWTVDGFEERNGDFGDKGVISDFVIEFIEIFLFFDKF